jgi:predicted nucleic acid-binding protein
VKKFVLDTNIYIAAARDRRFGAELVQFAGSYLPQLYLHAVVVQELMAGAIQEGARRRLERDVIQPFEKRGRIVLPTYRAWKRSGEIVATLVKEKVLTVGGVSRSFWNDAVLAVSCREEGVTVITRNEADFKRISKVERVSYVGPWPQPEI